MSKTESAADLKRKQVVLANAKAEFALAKDEVRSAQRHADACKRQVYALEQEMKDLLDDDVLRVSEHALLRFAERVYNFNTGKAEDLIRKDLGAAGKMGDGKYPLPSFPGTHAVIQNRVVVTILDKE